MTGAPLTARRVVCTLRSGSSWPIVVETDTDSRYLAKLRGSGHGTAALAAEIIVAHLAEALDLRVPARVLLSFDGALENPDRDAELADLLRASHGLNLGFAWLEGARPLGPSEVSQVPIDEAVRIVWLDWLTMNPDRTADNPNILVWKSQRWLIDHNSALGFQHDWNSVTEASPGRSTRRLSDHVLRDRAGDLGVWDSHLTARITRDTLHQAVADVPGDFLRPLVPAGSADEVIQRRRAAYVAFLWKRLRSPRPEDWGVGIPPGDESGIS